MGKITMHKLISNLANTAKAVAAVRSQRLYAFIRKVYRGKPYYCPVCNRRLWHFNFFYIWLLMKWDEYGYVHSIFAYETQNIFACSCPRCGANDRDRLYALYLKQELGRVDVTKRYSFIDFAPSVALSKAIRKYKFLNYRSADLFLDNVDDRVDIADMPIYKDNSIDIFLCSHVLEHVEDDRKAMAELYRILRQGGWGIVMVPVLLTLSHVYEDASIKSDADKWKHFGQPDHFRLYSKRGFTERLEGVGFKVDQFGIDYFGAQVFDKHGIHPRSVLYVVRKPLSKLTPTNDTTC